MKKIIAFVLVSTVFSAFAENSLYAGSGKIRCDVKLESICSIGGEIVKESNGRNYFKPYYLSVPDCVQLTRSEINYLSKKKGYNLVDISSDKSLPILQIYHGGSRYELKGTAFIASSGDVIQPLKMRVLETPFNRSYKKNFKRLPHCRDI